MLELDVHARMRAVMITAPRTCAIQQVDTPRPAADQVLIRVDDCGVCGSNLPLWESHEWFSYPTAAGCPGHDRVAFLSERAFAQDPLERAGEAFELLRMRPGGFIKALVMSMTRPRLGFLGVGWIGRHRMEEIAARDGAELVALCDPAPAYREAARAIAPRAKICAKPYKDARHLIDVANVLVLIYRDGTRAAERDLS